MGPAWGHRHAWRAGEGGSVLQHGPGRLVSIEDSGTIVRKSFLRTDPDRARRAADEFARHQRFWAAIGPVAGVTCPRPVELVEGPVPAIRMERVAGTPMFRLLRTESVDAGLHLNLTVAVAKALVTYVEVVAEPYHDFQFDNMLFDAASSSVVFVDFGLPDHADGGAGDSSPLEVSLGNLVGSTVFQTARPRWLLERRQHRQAVELCRAVVGEVVATAGEPVSAKRLQVEARLAYRRSAFPGRWSRHAWYGTVGYLLARRIQLLDVRFGPSGRSSS